MKKVVHVTWVEFETLRHRDENDCYTKGDAYISFEDNVLRYHEIIDVQNGYGRSNYTWDVFDVMVDNS